MGYLTNLTELEDMIDRSAHIRAAQRTKPAAHITRPAPEQVIAPAGFMPVPQRHRGPIPIRRAWDEKTRTITPGTDDWADKSLSEGDLAAIDQALAQIKARAGDRKLMLFYGVGTGNPDAAWGNNTELTTPAQAEVVGRQRNPGFVRAELAKPE